MSVNIGLRIEIGCGPNKREGFIGIDIIDAPGVDIILDVDKEKLPFADNSVEYVYSSHAFEHMWNYPFILQEIFRVCKPMATLEIWTPYGKSNDGLLFGHHTFFTETSFKHICFEYDRFYLGDCFGFFDWYKSYYVLYPNIVETLKSLNLPLDFALEHMFNIGLEWGVFLKVRKDLPKAPTPQLPARIFSYRRGEIINI